MLNNNGIKTDVLKNVTCKQTLTRPTSFTEDFRQFWRVQYLISQYLNGSHVCISGFHSGTVSVSLYYVSVRPFCVLENGGVSECYTGIFLENIFYLKLYGILIAVFIARETTTNTMRQVLGKLGLLRAPGEMKVGRGWSKHRIYDHGYRAVSKTCFYSSVAMTLWMVYKFISYRLSKFLIDNMLKKVRLQIIFG